MIFNLSGYVISRALFHRFQKFGLHIIFFLKPWHDMKNWYYKARWILQNETENSYYKAFTKFHKSLSQSGSGLTKYLSFTKCDRSWLQSGVITKCIDYNVWQTVITKCSRHYKGWHVITIWDETLVMNLFQFQFAAAFLRATFSISHFFDYHWL